jgi:hypothetical protein
MNGKGGGKEGGEGQGKKEGLAGGCGAKPLAVAWRAGGGDCWWEG